MIGVSGPDRIPAKGARLRATERDCWVALSLVPGIGPAGFAQLLRHHGSAARAWAACSEGSTTVVRLTGDARAMFDGPLRPDPREIARRTDAMTRAAGGRVVTGLDDEYPHALRTLDKRAQQAELTG